MLMNRNRANIDTIAQGKYFPNYREFISMLLTFSLTVFAWIFFRADNINDAFNYIDTIFSKSLFIKSELLSDIKSIKVIGLIILLIIVEWLGRTHKYALENISFFPKYMRWSVYLFILILLFVFQGSKQEFIYFQF
jgi:alginate O-acetyltransferase complex protein AlgI